MYFCDFNDCKLHSEIITFIFYELNVMIIFLGTQIFYLVDEAQHSNKGANTVTSMLHHHFMYHGLGETDVKLHMDNCSGQNKNNTVIG